MKKVFTGPKVHISSLNDTITCLHQMCDYWDFIVNPERQQKITGSKLIDSAIHGLFPGDLICTISESDIYGDAIARALAISGNKAGKDLLVIGFPHYLRDFWCEIFWWLVIRAANCCALLSHCEMLPNNIIFNWGHY